MNISPKKLNVDETTHVEHQLECLKIRFENSFKNQLEKILSLAKEKSTQIEQTKIELVESELFVSQSLLNKTLEERCVLKNESSPYRNESHISQTETVVSWCEKSDVNGLAKIFEYENNFVRFIWLLVLLFSLGVTAWIMSWSIIEYTQHGTVSKIEMIYERPTEFPAVTFCDNQPFTTQIGLDHVESFQNRSFNNSLSLFMLATMDASNPSFGDEKRKQLGLKTDQITCRFFNGDCKNDLHWKWSWVYGNCFQFNVGLNATNHYIDKKMTALEGHYYGLSIKISTFSSVNLTKIGIGSTSGLGMRVFIHNRTIQPRWSSEGVAVKPGESSMIEVKRTFVSNYPSPYSECTDLKSYSSLLYEFIIKSNRIYRQKDCLDLCIQQETINKCGCFSPNFDNPFSDTRPCLTLNESDCYTKIFSNFNPNNCALDFCPLECKSIDYDLTVSSVISPTLNDYNLLNSSSVLSFEEYRTRSVSFSVYYPYLEYTFIEVSPSMTMASLIANLGGTMSLIVSVSFFTFVEIIELIILILKNIISNHFY